MHIQAQHATRAAKNRYKWGLWATRRYIEKRGIPFGLYRLACQLEAGEKARQIKPFKLSINIDTTALDKAFKDVSKALGRLNRG